MRASLVGLVLVAGCWSGASPPQQPLAPPTPVQVTMRPMRPASPSPCVTAIDHAIELVRDELDQIATMRERIDLLRDAAVASCEATHWPTESLGCFENATDIAVMQTCQSQLTHDQSQDLSNRMMEVMSAATP